MVVHSAASLPGMTHLSNNRGNEQRTIGHQALLLDDLTSVIGLNFLGQLRHLATAGGLGLGLVQVGERELCRSSCGPQNFGAQEFVLVSSPS